MGEDTRKQHKRAKPDVGTWNLVTFDDSYYVFMRNELLFLVVKSQR